MSPKPAEQSQNVDRSGCCVDLGPQFDLFNAILAKQIRLQGTEHSCKCIPIKKPITELALSENALLTH